MICDGPIYHFDKIVRRTSINTWRPNKSQRTILRRRMCASRIDFTTYFSSTSLRLRAALRLYYKCSPIYPSRGSPLIFFNPILSGALMQGTSSCKVHPLRISSQISRATPMQLAESEPGVHGSSRILHDRSPVSHSSGKYRV
jgi:hypothetical protein